MFNKIKEAAVKFAAIVWPGLVPALEQLRQPPIVLRNDPKLTGVAIASLIRALNEQNESADQLADRYLEKRSIGLPDLNRRIGHAVAKKFVAGFHAYDFPQHSAASGVQIKAENANLNTKELLLASGILEVYSLRELEAQLAKRFTPAHLLKATIDESYPAPDGKNTIISLEMGWPHASDDSIAGRACRLSLKPLVPLIILGAVVRDLESEFATRLPDKVCDRLAAECGRQADDPWSGVHTRMARNLLFLLETLEEHQLAPAALEAIYMRFLNTNRLEEKVDAILQAAGVVNHAPASRLEIAAPAESTQVDPELQRIKLAVENLDKAHPLLRDPDLKKLPAWLRRFTTDFGEVLEILSDNPEIKDARSLVNMVRMKKNAELSDAPAQAAAEASRPAESVNLTPVRLNLRCALNGNGRCTFKDWMKEISKTPKEPLVLGALSRLSEGRCAYRPVGSSHPPIFVSRIYGAGAIRIYFALSGNDIVLLGGGDTNQESDHGREIGKAINVHKTYLEMGRTQTLEQKN